MSLKKINSQLARLESAAKASIALLNELSDNSFENSPIEKEPVRYIPEIIRQLNLAKAQAEEQAKFDGLTEEEIAERQKADREAEVDRLQQEAAQKLEDIRKKLSPEPEPAPEPYDVMA